MEPGAAPRVARLDDLPRGFVIAHRGGSLQVPENTLEGYRAAFAQGLAVIEQDVQVLADGALGVMHDATVDRTTTATGNVAEHTADSWRRLAIDAGAQLGGEWPDDLRAPLFVDVLAEFAGRVLLCPEAKSEGTMAPMLDTLEAHGADPAQVLVQSFALDDCRTAVRRGWPALWLGCTDPQRAAAEGVWAIGITAEQSSTELCRAAHELGVRVVCYTIDRHWMWAELLAHGVDGCFSDDPAYLTGPASTTGQATAPTTASTTSQAPAGVPSVPHLPPPGLQLEDGRRGRWGRDGAVAVDGAADGAQWVLAGHLSPPDPAAVVLDLVVALGRDATTGPDAALGGGAASVVLTTSDRPMTGRPFPGLDGYEVQLHRSGALELHRLTGGEGVLLARADGAPVDGGDVVPLRWTVAAGSLEVSRPGIPPLVVDDTAHRPVGVLHLGCRGTTARFSEVRFG